MNYITSTEQSFFSGRETQQPTDVNRKGEKDSFRTHIKPSRGHTHTINDHAEDPECAYMRQQIVMNTVHLSLIPPHEICAHSLTRSLTTRSTGKHTGLRNTRRWNVICSGGSEMRTGKVRELAAYSSSVRKAFCMSSTSCAYSALILASPSFTGSCSNTETVSQEACGISAV